WLMAVYGPLESEHDELKIEDRRPAPARDDHGEQLGAIASEPKVIRTSSGEQSARTSAQRSSRGDRIAAGCPGCQATLRVRRAYVGSDVECKHCGHIFPISAPADAHPEPVEDRKHQQLLDEQDRLMADHGQLQAKYDQLEVENGRLTEAQNQLSE